MKLRKVVLEKGVRHIPDKMAYGCKALTQVILPDTAGIRGKECVGRYTFSGAVDRKTG